MSNKTDGDVQVGVNLQTDKLGQQVSKINHQLQKGIKDVQATVTAQTQYWTNTAFGQGGRSAPRIPTMGGGYRPYAPLTPLLEQALDGGGTNFVMPGGLGRAALGGLRGLGGMAGGTLAAGALGGAAGLVGAATITAGTEGFKRFIPFERAINEVATVADMTAPALDKFTKSVKDLSVETGESAEMITNAAYNAFQSLPEGTSPEAVLGLVENVEKLNKVIRGDLDTTLKSVTSTMNAYNYGLEEQDYVIKTLFATYVKGEMEGRQLAQDLPQVTSIASALGVELDQVGASMAAMTVQGLTASERATQLKAMLSEFSDSGSQASKVLAGVTQDVFGVAKSFKDLMAEGYDIPQVLQLLGDAVTEDIQEVFSSIEAGQAALALSAERGKEVYSDTAKSVAEDLLDMDKAHKTLDDTQTALDKSTQKLNVALKDLGATLAPLGIGFVTLASDVATAFVKSVDFIAQGTVSVAKKYAESARRDDGYLAGRVNASQARYDASRGVNRDEALRYEYNASMYRNDPTARDEALRYEYNRTNNAYGSPQPDGPQEPEPKAGRSIEDILAGLGSSVQKGAQQGIVDGMREYESSLSRINRAMTMGTSAALTKGSLTLHVVVDGTSGSNKKMADTIATQISKDLRQRGTI